MEFLEASLMQKSGCYKSQSSWHDFEFLESSKVHEFIGEVKNSDNLDDKDIHALLKTVSQMLWTNISTQACSNGHVVYIHTYLNPLTDQVVCFNCVHFFYLFCLFYLFLNIDLSLKHL